MSKKKRRKEREQRQFLSLEDHRRDGKKLQHPISSMKQMKFASWIHERLPDQLVAVLLVTQLDRMVGLEVLREVGKACQGAFRPGQPIEFSLTGIAAMPAGLADRLISRMVSAPGARRALDPLLLFPDLPARERWAKHLSIGIDLQAWNELAQSIAASLFHQSEAATDARWAKLLVAMASGQLTLGSEEQFRMLTEYPRFGDLRQVRPFIRAGEIAEAPGVDRSARARWSESFWQQCYKRTPCGDYIQLTSQGPVSSTSRTHVLEVMRAVATAAESSAATSRADARRDSTFGIAEYSLSILHELLGMGVSSGILGRLGLRTILECYLTLAFLAKRDDAALWTAYREYGHGQAKLAMHKALDASRAPSFVTPELLEQIASEDKGADYVAINLGHWAHSDLRKLSEQAGAKAEYDRLYPWTSAFMHGNWAAVSSATMSVCGNPLHRMHSVLQPLGNALDDVLDESILLMNAMLDLVCSLYPVDLPRLPNPTHDLPQPDDDRRDG